MDYVALINVELDAADALVALATEEKRELSAEELLAHEEHIAKAEELKTSKEKFEAIQARRSQFEAIDDSASASAPVKTGVTDIQTPLVASDPAKGFKSPMEFLMSVKKHSRYAHLGKAGVKDERLHYLMVQGSDEQNSLADEYGNFFVPSAFSPNMQQIKPENNPLVGRTTSIPMTTPLTKFPARVDKDHATTVTGGVQVYRKEQTVDGNTSRSKFAQIELKANTLFGATFATEELLTDSAVSFTAIIGNEFQQAFNDRHFEELLRGSGVGEYQGVFNSKAFISVPKESGQTADTINVNNVLNMRSRCYGYGNAVWLANHNTLPQLAQLTLGAAGHSLIYMPSIQDDVPDRLLGRPIFYTEYTEKLGDANDLVLVNMSEYLEGTLQGMQSDESIHVRFLANERCFRFSVRNDGRSWWDDVLKPKRGAPTMSPFLGLAERA